MDNLAKDILKNVPHIILMGPSGSGKDTIQKGLQTLGFTKNVTYTTRPQRPSEFDGVDYHFISEKEFKKMEARKAFAETAEYNASFGTCHYGSLVSEYRGGSVSILTPGGVFNLINNTEALLNMADNSSSDVHFNIYLICTPYMFERYNFNVHTAGMDFNLKDDEDLFSRLTKRGDASEELYRRLESDSEMFGHKTLRKIERLAACSNYVNDFSGKGPRQILISFARICNRDVNDAVKAIAVDAFFTSVFTLGIIGR